MPRKLPGRNVAYPSAWLPEMEIHLGQMFSLLKKIIYQIHLFWIFCEDDKVFSWGGKKKQTLCNEPQCTSLNYNRNCFLFFQWKYQAWNNVVFNFKFGACIERCTHCLFLYLLKTEAKSINGRNQNMRSCWLMCLRNTALIWHLHLYR